MHLLFKKIIKAIRLAPVTLYRRALYQGVAAAIEHERLFVSLNCQTVVDIGANRGQFSLMARHCFPKGRIVSFEPLPGPASIFRRVFSGDSAVVLNDAAIGPEAEHRTMHISKRDDSSLLLPISSVQTAMFPGTGEIATTTVRVAPLDNFVRGEEIVGPAMLKLDVQGFEHEALLGCESLLPHFDLVYCESSFVELYLGQKLAWEIIDWLAARGVRLVGIFNTTYDQHGQAVQADFLFGRKGDRDLVGKALP